MRLRRALATAGLLLLCGTATAGLFTDDEAHRKIQGLAQDNQRLTQNVQALEARVNDLSSQLKAQGLIDLVNQLETIEAELARLRGQVELVAHQIETLDKRNRDLYVDLDTRLRKLERVGEAAAISSPPQPATAAPTSPPQAPAAAAPEDGSQEMRAYEAAFNQFKIGNYAAAIAAFDNFIKAYPASPLAANAQYWIGNGFHALRDYKAAIAAQQKLLATYPNSPKVPDALLNMATAQAELGDRTAARKTLEDILAKYPGSPAAESAKKRLATLK